MRYRPLWQLELSAEQRDNGTGAGAGGGGGVGVGGSVTDAETESGLNLHPSEEAGEETE